jgi:hydroxypyruvate isomerase
MTVHRRKFLSIAAGTVATSALGARSSPVRAETSDEKKPSTAKRFTLNFAPHFGMFAHSAGKGLADQLKFAADQGFSAWEDNEMKNRSVANQQEIAHTMAQLDMKMGVVSALRGKWNKITFAGGDQGARDEVLQSMRDIVDVAKRVNTKRITVVPGWRNPQLSEEEQTSSCIELLKRCCEIVGPHELVMVIEPLNREKNNPKVFLNRGPQAFDICRAVDHPSCKVLFDMYHQQLDVGNLTRNLDRCWSEIAYLQCGDAPTGKEPGTGEINYANIMRHIRDKAYTGILGMEHGNSKPGAAGERAVIDAYRKIDPT